MHDNAPFTAGLFGRPAAGAASNQYSFYPAQAHEPAPAVSKKRKGGSWTMEEFSYQQTKQMRIGSPRLDRRHTFPDRPPDLIPDSSATASDEDVGMDQDMDMSSDQDQEMEMGEDGGAGNGGFEYENGAVDHARMRNDDVDHGRSTGYAFGASGSGGFGFGPGAMEDEEDDGSETSAKWQIYPSLTPHTNPNHFSNQPSSLRPKSPLSAQPYSTSLRAPRTAGLLQPTAAAPLGPNATEVERARAQHGPQCRSIPKLVLSQYPDPATGQRSMWTQCVDCGAVEMKM